MSKLRGRQPPENRAQKVAVNWEHDPPACRSCTYFQKTGQVCQVNKFATVAYAVCDMWTSRKGETLEECLSQKQVNKG